MFIELLDKSLQPPIEKLKYNWKFPHGHRWTPVGRKNWEGAGRGKGESRDSARRIWGKLAYLQFSTFFWKPSKYFDCVSFLRFSRNTHLKYHAYHFPRPYTQLECWTWTESFGQIRIWENNLLLCIQMKAQKLILRSFFRSFEKVVLINR